MNSHSILSHLQRLKSTVVVAALLTSLVAVCAVGVMSSTAQTPPEERELEDKIPKHLPIKVEIKNLGKENWVREMEVEVTNTSDKPIYYLRFSLTMPEVRTETGSVVGVGVSYGRLELGVFEGRPTPEDVPIKPGETQILKVPKNQMRGWESARDRYKWPTPKKLRIKFRSLHYGDGTGFTSTPGLPVPDPRSRD